MQTGSPSVPNSIDDDTRYTAEVRFGVVMYGGVSLAVYINGVTNEIYEMACATPRALLPAPKQDSTREVYERLSWLTASAGLRAAYAKALLDRPDPTIDVWATVPREGADRSRLVVDVVSGTSAGGINGVFLAKALANGEEFGPLHDLWLAEGDIGKLLNDHESYEGLDGLEGQAVERSAAPKSLLNSDRMYLKLLEALQRMDKVEGRPDGPESPLVEQMDLFVTTTDILGAPVELRLFDKVVYERRYKQSFHFQYPGGAPVDADATPDANDFRPEHAPFLAFAARCTSSFPFAFEPMRLHELTTLGLGFDTAALRRWDPYFASLPAMEVHEGSHVWRAFGDGGYLDNKPFSYVVSALATRLATVPVERKLLYVEPSPEQINPHERPGPRSMPDALGNAFAALTVIPSYEGIREDLQNILQRNRRIERVERIVRLGEDDVEDDRDPFRNVVDVEGRIPAWTSLSFKAMAGYYGAAFLPYLRLRLYAVTDRIGDRLARRFRLEPDSDHQYALRALVRVWRDRHFEEEPEDLPKPTGDAGTAPKPTLDALLDRFDVDPDRKQTVNAFLDQFDVDYRLRRLAFLLRKVDQVTRLFRERRAGSAAPPLSDTSDRVLGIVNRHFEPDDPTASRESSDEAVAVLRLLKIGLLEARRSVDLLQRTGPAAFAPDDPLVDELGDVLRLLLDESPPAEPQEPKVPRPAAGKEPPLRHRTAVTLARIDGESVQVPLDPGWLRASSASQTLQETVLARAAKWFEAAERLGPTRLVSAIEGAIDAERFKSTPGRAPMARAMVAADLLWDLLGTPELVKEAPGSPIVVRVGAAKVWPGAPEDASLLLDSDIGRKLREVFGEYALRFDSFDQISFPLYYDTGTGEPAICDVVRVSPVDATRLVDETAENRKKLAGTAVAHFGAFLDVRWRRNDVMWGRLDGAERLVTALLPASDLASLACRIELVDLAHRRILREELTGRGKVDLTGLLCEALAEVDGANPEQRLRDLLEQLGFGDTAQRDKLRGALVSLLDEEQLVQYVRTRYDVNPEPEPKELLRNTSRAVTITGRLLEGISRRFGKEASAATRWLARGGLLLQGIVAVSLPGAYKQRWFEHAVHLVYAFEVVALLFALLFGGHEMRSLTATALVVTVALHFLSLVAGDVMRERKRWRRIGLAIAVASVGGLAVLGAVGWRNVGFFTQICGDAQSAEDASWFCRHAEAWHLLSPAPDAPADPIR